MIDARIPDHCGWAARGHWCKAYKALLEDHQALRERAEAAEAERDVARKWEAHYHSAWGIACEKRWKATDRAVSLETELAAVRRAEAAPAPSDGLRGMLLDETKEEFDDFDRGWNAAIRAAPSDGLRDLTDAWKAHCDAVEAYNGRRAIVEAERQRGSYGLNLDPEYQAMEAARVNWLQTAQRVALAALTPAPVQEGGE